ncbi:MAG TPA: ABC transporter permease [Patescibacteria group bacterium]|nr:ABC transporter permease [Patescibacteria group bacterium]
MFKNYLKTAWRNIARHKGYSFINIFGLAVGIACCLLIMLYVRYEHSYDRFHAYEDRIFRIEPQFLNADGSLRQSFGSLAPGFVPFLENEFPEIERIVKVLQLEQFGESLVTYGDRKFNEKRFYLSEPALFDIFTLPLSKGNPQTALQDPNNLVISESMAAKYFGTDDPLGKMLKIDLPILGSQLLTITAVMKDSPANTHAHFDFIGSLLLTKNIPRGSDYFYGTANLSDNVTQVYLRLAAGVKPAVVSGRLPAVIDRAVPPRPDEAGNLVPMSKRGRLLLRRVTDIHLDAHTAKELEPNGDRATVTFFMVIAFFILLLACINFTNLATARASRRAREVGLRKVVGGNRGMLAVQFLSESLLISCLALLLALFLVWILLPLFSGLFNCDLSFRPLLEPQSLLLLAVILIFTALCSGIYPALYLSSFKPATILRGELTRGSGGARLRKALVVFQFAIATILIVSVGVTMAQMRFFRNADIGFDRENILLIPVDGTIVQNWQNAKESIIKSPYVKAATLSKRAPSHRLLDAPGFSIEVGGRKLRNDFPMPHNRVDFDFFKTYDIPIVAGRDFSQAHPTDATAAFILNETAVHQLGWRHASEAIGKTMSVSGRPPAQIIGVVADFNYESLHNKIPAIVTYIVPNQVNTVSVRIHPGNPQRAIDQLRTVWQRYNPGFPFRFYFLDEQLNSLYQNEKRMMDMFGTFSILAVIIACLGLFGLASFAAAKRTKEIGVRKVFGASIARIVGILVREFLWLVLIANLLAWPLAYFAMRSWLQGFAYRISLGISVFMLSGLLTLCIALCTVSYQAMRAARANPVDSLRYE